MYSDGRADEDAKKLMAGSSGIVCTRLLGRPCGREKLMAGSSDIGTSAGACPRVRNGPGDDLMSEPATGTETGTDTEDRGYLHCSHKSPRQLNSVNLPSRLNAILRGQDGLLLCPQRLSQRGLVLHR